MQRADSHFALMRKLAFASVATAVATSPLWLIASDEKPAGIHAAADVSTERVDFRVASRVYEEKRPAPVSDSLTIFIFDGDGDQRHRRCYDFLSSSVPVTFRPQEITIFDAVRQRTERKDENGILNVATGDQTTIFLIDPERRVRAQLDDQKLAGFAQQLRSRAAKQSKPLLKFAADPKFSESFERTDDGGACVRFTSPRWAGCLLAYRVWLASDVDENVDFDPYFDFCDYSAQLNSMMHPGALPPFPRIEVDSVLRSKAARPPTRVEVTISDDPNGTPLVLRSEHHFSTQLTAADRQRIDEANEELKTFKQVSWEEYVRPIQQAKR